MTLGAAVATRLRGASLGALMARVGLHAFGFGG